MSRADTRIAEAHLEPYALKLAHAWRTSRGIRTIRRGWLVRLVDEDGREARGECAPWPDAGTEDDSGAERALRSVVPTLAGCTVTGALAELERLVATPAARCGLEAALLGLQAKLRAVSLRHLLAPDAADTVRVNAVLGAADSGLAEACEAAVAAGFSVLKVKIGIGPWTEELAKLRGLALPPGASLRLDSNGAWDEPAAVDRLTSLAGLPVEAVEEPLSRYDPDALARLQSSVDFPLALDESVAGHAAAVLDGGCPVRRLVLKPMVLGGARAAVAIAKRAQVLGLETVVTTTLEAAPGRWLAAAVAAASGSTLAHGLDTGDWLAEDLGAGPLIAEGRLRF